jgi:Spy/CpxP family protein refolding chaperone
MERGGIVMKILRTLLVLTAIVGALSLPAFAQQGPAGGKEDVTGFDRQPGRGGTISEAKREEIRKKIEAVRIWRLTEELNLDANSAAKLSAFLSSFDQQRREIMRDQMATMRELRRFLNASEPDESKLKAAIEKLEKNRHALQESRDKETAGLKNILSTKQQARFLLFQQEFRREMQNMIAGARGGAGEGRMGPGMRRGQGPGPGMGDGPGSGGSSRPPDQ